MFRRCPKLVVRLVAALAFFTGAAHAYPDKPIRIIIPYAPGGGADGVSRLLAQRLEKSFGQPVLVESRAGGNTVIAAQAVARAAPDGYTLLMTGGSTMSLIPLTSKKVPYDPLADFAPISILSKGPYLLCVSAELGVNTLDEVLALARAKPGALSYASNAIGGSAHLGMELLAQRAKVQLNHVPYKGFAPAIGDVVSGRTPLAMLDQATLGGFGKSGRIKVLAATSLTRSSMYPDVPTLAELGFPGYELETWFALYAPAGTPDSIIEKLGAEVRAWLSTPEAQQALNALGQEAAASTPEAVRDRIKSEQQSYGPLIEAAKISTD
ncbi:tripartite tricarboxylate transporter substrate binding protein [Pigmentiphaga sp.]|uniref:Bug family tripartite tricarboxylate transporter substrate binding protein n=1 Tax=Pigmentiphaga sp. TaxID=1977564 RepID=UPI0025E633F0|nr:tripartite tricarboxylate transporter substrate binding protein [Pigmentiphaga sp.]MBX6316921.1 tripartite tricarboxylate transporter substrate binding protein [Pigmentiphaga sp.]